MLVFISRVKAVVYAERHKERQGIKLLLVKQTFVINRTDHNSFFFPKQNPNEKEK